MTPYDDSRGHIASNFGSLPAPFIRQRTPSGDLTTRYRSRVDLAGPSPYKPGSREHASCRAMAFVVARGPGPPGRLAHPM